MTQVSKNTATQNKTQEQPPSIQGSTSQVIYADRILSVGFGPVVSKLMLGVEIGPNTFAPFANLVIPTIALMEATEFMQKTLTENEQMNTAILNGMDKVKAHIEQKKKK